MSNQSRIVITFLLGCFIFVAIPIASWGITDIATFFENPFRLLYVVSALVLNAFAAIRIPEVGKISELPKTTIQRQHLVVILLQAHSLFLVAVSPYCDHGNIAAILGEDFLRPIGLGLYVIGFLTMHFSQAQLGRHFSVEVSIKKDHLLVTDGLYRRLRHPRYLEILVFSFGISLVFRSWLAVLASAAVIPVLLWRIRDEELLMRQEFGSQWEAYSERSWRLIPHVY